MGYTLLTIYLYWPFGTTFGLQVTIDIHKHVYKIRHRIVLKWLAVLSGAVTQYVLVELYKIC